MQTQSHLMTYKYHTHTNKNIDMSAHTHTYKHAHACTHTRIQTLTRTHTHTNRNTDTHTHSARFIRKANLSIYVSTHLHLIRFLHVFHVFPRQTILYLSRRRKEIILAKTAKHFILSLFSGMRCDKTRGWWDGGGLIRPRL